MADLDLSGPIGDSTPPTTAGGWVGPYPDEDTALAYCGSSGSGSGSDISGSGGCPDGIPTTLMLVYSCENCECRTVEFSPITGPTATGPGIYTWGMSANNCGADAGDYVILDCNPEGSPTWTFVHASGYDTVGPINAASYDPLFVDFGQYQQQNCDMPGGPCTVTLTE